MKEAGNDVIKGRKVLSDFDKHNKITENPSRDKGKEKCVENYTVGMSNIGDGGNKTKFDNVMRRGLVGPYLAREVEVENEMAKNWKGWW